MAKRYNLDKKDMKSLGKVIAYSTVASFVGILLSSLAQIDVPVQYGFVVPIINTALVALKDFAENRTS